MLVRGVAQNRRSDFRMFGTNGFHAKAKNERFTAADSCCQNLEFENFTDVVVWQTTL